MFLRRLWLFSGGMTIPLMSEFSDYNKGDTAQGKQDCEQIAFKRLAYRLKKAFPKYGFMLLVDGLYAVGPAVEQCRSNNWDFMIVLQDGSLPQVWEEYELLKKLLEKEDCLVMKWGDRIQHFHWINDIEYTYGPGGRKRQIVHVVVCEESWQGVDPNTGEIVTNRGRHVWLSGGPLNRDNVHERCNLGAPARAIAGGPKEGFLA